MGGSAGSSFRQKRTKVPPPLSQFTARGGRGRRERNTGVAFPTTRGSVTKGARRLATPEGLRGRATGSRPAARGWPRRGGGRGGSRGVKQAQADEALELAEK